MAGQSAAATLVPQMPASHPTDAGGVGREAEDALERSSSAPEGGCNDQSLLKVSALGAGPAEGVLVELNGCKLLVGCPWGTVADLEALGLTVGEIDAVLLTSVQSGCGLPELFGSSGRQGIGRAPRMLGTIPVLAALEARLADIAAAVLLEEARDAATVGPREASRRRRTTREDVQRMLEVAQEVSYGEEVVIEGVNGPVVATAACSGYGLGGCYWTLQSLGVNVAAMGASSFCTGGASRYVNLDPVGKANVLIIPSGSCNLSGARHSREVDTAKSMAVVASEAAALVKAGNSVVMPVGGDLFTLTVDIVEALGHALAELPREAQVPIFVVGSLARFLRRCSTYAEWAESERLDDAYEGRSPFLLEDLRLTHRLVLADSLHDLKEAYREPFVALLPALGPDDDLETKPVPAVPSASGVVERAPSVMAHLRGLVGPASPAGAGGQTGSTPPCVLLEICLGTGSSEGSAPKSGSRCRRVELRPCIGEVAAALQASSALEAVVTSPPASWPGASSSAPSPRTSEEKLLRLELRRSVLTRVPLDLSKPRMGFWLPEDELRPLLGRLSEDHALSEQHGKRRGGAAALCPLSGHLIFSKRPRLSAHPAPPAAASVAAAAAGGPRLLLGVVDVKAFVAALARRGHKDVRLSGTSASSGSVRIEVPALRATVLLNRPAAGSDGAGAGAGLETVVQAPTAAARRLIGEALASVLLQL
mmetsp:Transcript_47396/g.151107  ORF Transcript_47396/g.151107 Transcript_47396/m.151107 type:complete len:708 (+) Transcript_47396:278-2401(+)